MSLFLFPPKSCFSAEALMNTQMVVHAKHVSLESYPRNTRFRFSQSKKEVHPHIRWSCNQFCINTWSWWWKHWQKLQVFWQLKYYSRDSLSYSWSVCLPPSGGTWILGSSSKKGQKAATPVAFQAPQLHPGLHPNIAIPCGLHQALEKVGSMKIYHTSVLLRWARQSFCLWHSCVVLWFFICPGVSWHFLPCHILSLSWVINQVFDKLWE